MMYFNRGFDGYSRFNGCFGSGYFGPWGMFIGLGIIVLIVALVVWAVLKKKKENDPILLSLKEKFVRGEITEEEYLSKKRTLNLK
jgi:putative membrane protein